MNLVDCGVHAKTWDLLRLTRMPAVRIDLGYLTNPDEARKLRDDSYRDGLAAAVSEAIKEFFQPAEV